MGNLHDLLLLLILGGSITAWMKLSRAREIAVSLARRHCELHGLQLLDETVGLRALRLRRVDGQRRLERGYAFDVSVDGDDRKQGRVWMIGQSISGLSLPTGQWMMGGVDDSAAAVRPPPEGRTEPGATSNVVPLRPRLPDHRP